MKIVKCKKCGTEYESPFPEQYEIQMDDCPICKALEKKIQEILKE